MGYMGSPVGPTLHPLGCGQCRCQQAITEPAGGLAGAPLSGPENTSSVSYYTGQISQASQAIDTLARVVEGKPLEQQSALESWWSHNWGWVAAGAAVLWLSTVGIQAVPQWMTALRR